MRASPRYAMSRLEQGASPVRPVPRSGHAHDEAATAVRTALCTDPADDTGDLSKFDGTLFGNRYVHYWLMRHLHLPPDRLTAILSDALDVSRPENRGILLPELPTRGGTSSSRALTGSGAARFTAVAALPAV